MVPARVRGALYDLLDDKYYPARGIQCCTCISKFEEASTFMDNADDREQYAHAHQPVYNVRTSRIKCRLWHGRHNTREADGVDPRVYNGRQTIWISIMSDSEMILAGLDAYW